MTTRQSTIFDEPHAKLERPFVVAGSRPSDSPVSAEKRTRRAHTYPFMSRRTLALFIGDVLIVVGVGLAVAMMRGARLGVVTELGVVYVLAFYFTRIYPARTLTSPTQFLTRLMGAIALVVLVLVLKSYAFPTARFPGGVLALHSAVILMAVPAWRWAARTIVRSATRPIRVAVVGAGRAARSLIDVLDSSEDYEVVGIYDDDKHRWSTRIGRHDVVGPSSQILVDGAKDRIDMVTVAITHEKSEALVQTLVACRRYGLRVADMIQPYESISGRLPVEHLSSSWVAFGSDLIPVRDGVYAVLKRMVDIVGAAVLLTFAFLPIIIAGICIKLDSRGPILYRQRRVGIDRREFKLLKLRTMRCDAEASTGPVWASENDGRTTRVGKFLRKSRLDEFPQLVNVLLGHMSLIGPRPERPEFVTMLEQQIPHYDLRHIVRPGVTGWAQVCYPYGSSVQDGRCKLEYDLYYIRHMDLMFDVRILLRTVRVLIFAKGSR